MPWQRYVVDVALEIDPATGLLAYREVVLTVPRQSGKTTLLLAAMVHRALGFGQRQSIVYTAQTRNHARQKWEDEHVATLEASALAPLFKVRRANGNEAILWRNRSKHGITSTTKKAGHGDTLDLAVMDEAFAHEDDSVEQGLRPTMVTRPQPQLWPVSTAGTKTSTYLRGKVDAGRARVEAGRFSSACYFEWSAPHTADPGDPATWRACMPALGITVTEGTIRSEFENMKLPEFRRAYLNQWLDEVPDEWTVIARAAWNALADPDSAIEGPVAFSADVNPDRTAGAIAVAGRRSDGKRHVEVVEYRVGTDWIVERLLDLRAAWSTCAVVIDAAGPAGSLIAPLEAAGVDVIKPTSREAAHACGQLYDGVEEDDIRHLDQAPLSAALAGAQKRDLGDAWAWGRKASSVDLSPLVAATNASWAHTAYAHLYEDVDDMDNIW